MEELMQTILVCDDDKEIVEAIEIYLQQEGYHILKAYDGEEALEVLKENEVHLLIMDVMMPRLDGIRATLKIREESSIPIIILSAKTEDADKILGLNIGADDYVEKPFNPLELVTRVKSQLRRYRWYNTKEDKESEEFHIRGLDIWKDRHLCTLNGKDLELTPMEFDIVWLLCENANKVVDTEQLFETVWKEKYLENNNNTVMAHVARIREKMHEVPRKPKYIKTVWGVGYKIDG